MSSKRWGLCERCGLGIIGGVREEANASFPRGVCERLSGLQEW